MRRWRPACGLVVSVKAALDGQGAIAMGNVLGSNALNVGLILGLTALICPLKVQLQILRIDAPIMVLVSLIGGWMLADLHISRVEGLVLLGGLLVYVVFTVWYAKTVLQSIAVQAEYAEALPPPRGSVWRDILFVLGGLALLVAGSRYMVDGSITLARLFGISEAVIGLTIVAAGTSMPELVTCVVAALKKEPDIAIGNVIGSNIFNTLGILGGAAVTRPLFGEGIQMTDIYVSIAFAILLVPMLRTGAKLMRWEGVLLLAAYVGYMAWLWPK